MVNARVREGASNSAYRADDEVSGSSTTTLPRPAAASPRSPAMAVKLSVNDSGERALDEVPPGTVVGDELSELQPAASRPPISSMVTSPLRAVRRKMVFPSLAVVGVADRSTGSNRWSGPCLQSRPTLDPFYTAC